ncbi:MAG: flagellar hook basal-body protein [Planctomycetes bacterium]|nr:flagellar hook basal-body protein [Planctomycetota bacterium]
MADTVAQIGASVEALEKQFDITAHNMANVSTAGFKRRCNNFTQAIAAQYAGVEGAIDAELSESPVDFSQGALVQTDRTLDVALYGKGFFVIESPEGPLYTRHGVFQTNPNGQIVDTMGRLVAGAAGPLLVPGDVDVSQIHIDSAGRVNAGPAALGRFRIVEFGDQEDQLRPTGLDCFFAPPEVPPKEAASVSVRQGYEEASNVKLIDELVNMILVSRLYEANMKLMTVSSETSGSAISVAMG